MMENISSSFYNNPTNRLSINNHQSIWSMVQDTANYKEQTLNVQIKNALITFDCINQIWSLIQDKA